MKRIPQKAALQTILYYIGGLQKIKVVDYKNRYEASVNGEHTVIFEGMYKDEEHRIINHKQLSAEIRGIRANGEELIIGICTEDEIFA